MLLYMYSLFRASGQHHGATSESQPAIDCRKRAGFWEEDYLDSARSEAPTDRQSVPALLHVMQRNLRTHSAYSRRYGHLAKLVLVADPRRGRHALALACWNLRESKAILCSSRSQPPYLLLGHDGRNEIGWPRCRCRCYQDATQKEMAYCTGTIAAQRLVWPSWAVPGTGRARYGRSRPAYLSFRVLRSYEVYSLIPVCVLCVKYDLRARWDQLM